MMAEIACKFVLNPMVPSPHPTFRRTTAAATDFKSYRRPATTASAARNGGFSLPSVFKRCGECGGKGAVECPGCKGTGRNKKNGNIFERWKCFDCQGFGLKSCPECGKGGLTPEQRDCRSVAMDSMKGQEGIQMLLNAEQEAQQIVSNARNMKMQRLKQAKNEADDEIARYRGHMEDEHQKRISESTGSSGSNVKRLEEETKAKINDLKGSASQVSPEIISLLLKYVTAIRN